MSRAKKVTFELICLHGYDAEYIPFEVTQRAAIRRLGAPHEIGMPFTADGGVLVRFEVTTSDPAGLVDRVRNTPWYEFR